MLSGCIGGVTVASLVRRILSQLFSLDLAMKYNFSGAKGKKKFPVSSAARSINCRSLQHMLHLPPLDQVELLNQQNLTFTFLMPHDLAVDFLSYADLSYLHNMQDDNRQKVFWRHALNGSEITYDDLRQGHVNSFLLPPEVTFSKLGTGLYFRYHGINSRVTRWNLVACNGIIHLLTHFLYTSPASITTYYPADTPTSRTDPVHAVGANKLKPGGVGMLCKILLVFSFGRLAFLVIST